MNTQNVYLVDISSISPHERAEVEHLLRSVATLISIHEKPLSYIVYTSYIPEVFGRLQFPSGCTWKNITGWDLLKL